jgi:solute carrier family 25 (mitochondrial adenine nucleotide translocator), member 4/5/6/31
VAGSSGLEEEIKMVESGAREEWRRERGGHGSGSPGTPSESSNSPHFDILSWLVELCIFAVMADSTFLIDFLVGGVSGAISKTLMAPIERAAIYTRYRTPVLEVGSTNRTELRKLSLKEKYEFIRRLVNEGGPHALWRGNLTNVIRYFPTQAFNFAFNDAFKRQLSGDSSQASLLFLANIASGSLAGFTTLCVVYPLDYARIRLANDVGPTRHFHGLADSLKKIAIGPGGVRTLYTGFGIAVIGVIPYRGIYFGLYSSLSAINPFGEDRFIGLGSQFVIAQCTAIAASYSSYPLDTIRRRLSISSEKPLLRTYRGIGDCFIKIYKNEGIGGLYKGAGANSFRTVGSAFCLVLYDQIKAQLGFETRSFH